MKKTLLFSLPFLLLSIASSAQEKTVLQKPGMSIYIEAGGPGVISFNYDTRFTASDKGFGGRIGIGGYKTNNYGAVYVPVGLTYLLSKNDRDYIELGAGFTFVDYTRDNNEISLFFTNSFGHLNFGYRYQQKGGGLVLRVAINPVFGNGFFFPAYGGLSLGYKF